LSLGKISYGFMTVITTILTTTYQIQIQCTPLSPSHLSSINVCCIKLKAFQILKKRTSHLWFLSLTPTACIFNIKLICTSQLSPYIIGAISHALQPYCESPQGWDHIPCFIFPPGPVICWINRSQHYWMFVLELGTSSPDLDLKGHQS
jgi:hypothetical protein